ncbi:MAG: deoxyguanosinetriphosphate triphosphohydrolase [Burkholderiaceae bacterium]
MALAAYACDPAQSRGRRHQEPPAPTRSDFQRDRDRVIHCSAFRRLVYKTQVFLNHEGDLFRTRLTHSLEVAQLGRSIARTLGLHEDLVEAIALSHDLGHTPFGHAGQDALNDCMGDFGGFEHNLQSLRVVDLLEERYPDFDGLNLTFETREGILKHCANQNAQLIESQEPRYADGSGGVGRRFLDRTQPSLEAQLCNLADEIAYNAHDIDDGVRSGLITIEQLESVALFRQHLDQTRQRHPHLSDVSQGRRLLYETIRQMLSAQVYDVIDATTLRLQAVAPRDVYAVRAAPPLVAFSEPMRRGSMELKQFLLRNLYRHPRVMATTNQARRIVRDLFALYMDAPESMQPGFAARSEAIGQDLDEVQARARVVADFIAGMTDRFAVREHERITGERLLA